jgi:hypothetical protein
VALERRFPAPVSRPSHEVLRLVRRPRRLSQSRLPLHSNRQTHRFGWVMGFGLAEPAASSGASRSWVNRQIVPHALSCFGTHAVPSVQALGAGSAGLRGRRGRHSSSSNARSSASRSPGQNPQRKPPGVSFPAIGGHGIGPLDHPVTLQTRSSGRTRINQAANHGHDKRKPLARKDPS